MDAVAWDTERKILFRLLCFGGSYLIAASEEALDRRHFGSKFRAPGAKTRINFIRRPPPGNDPKGEDPKGGPGDPLPAGSSC